jgi:RNA recognition motif-containing protein
MEARLFIGNLSNDTVAADLRSALVSNGIDVVAIEVVLDPETGRPRGFAFVELADAAAIPHAIERLDRYDVNGRAISVRETKVRPSTYLPRQSLSAAQPLSAEVAEADELPAGGRPQ